MSRRPACPAAPRTDEGERVLGVARADLLFWDEVERPLRPSSAAAQRATDAQPRTERGMNMRRMFRSGGGFPRQPGYTRTTRGARDAQEARMIDLRLWMKLGAGPTGRGGSRRDCRFERRLARCSGSAVAARSRDWGSWEVTRRIGMGSLWVLLGCPVSIDCCTVDSSDVVSCWPSGGRTLAGDGRARGGRN